MENIEEARQYLHEYVNRLEEFYNVKYVSNEGKYDNMTEDEFLSEAESWTEEEQINYLLQGGYTDKSGFINLTDIIIDEIFPEETRKQQ